MKTENFQKGFLIVLVTVVTIFFFWMIRSMVVTMLLAAIFASLTRPMYLKILSWTGRHARLASGISVFLFFLLVALPLFGFLGIVANQAVNVTQTVKPWVEENLSTKQEMNESLEKVPGYSYIRPYRETIIRKASQTLATVGDAAFKKVSAFTAGTFVLLMDFAIMLYAMFFFYVDGPEILRKILYCLPLNSHDEKKILDGLQNMTRATIKGLVVIGVIQGTLAGLALWAAGVPGSLFWGTVMTVLSIIPNIGSTLVWIPACVYLYIKGQTTAATLVFLWCALVVGTVDNFLRPVLVGRDTKVHELLVLVGTIGGLTLMGLEGFILGPAVALLFLTIWDIYAASFRDVLPKVGRLD